MWTPASIVLQESLETFVAEAEQNGLPRSETFTQIWKLAHEALGKKAGPLSAGFHGRGRAAVVGTLVLLCRTDESSAQRFLAHIFAGNSVIGVR